MSPSSAGGRGSQHSSINSMTCAISFSFPRQQGGSQTRARADDFRDEPPNYFADDFELLS